MMEGEEAEPLLPKKRQRTGILQGPNSTVFRGCVVHCPSIGEVALDLDATVVVNLATGHIDQYYPTERKDEAEVKELLDDAKTRGSLKVLGMREFLLPGFVDCHAHAPQFSYTGTGLDLPLMGAEGWLERYTFPSERSLGHNANRACAVYSRAIARTLQSGTTTSCYFGSLHTTPTLELASRMVATGQRGFVGKVCMDRNSPEDYSNSTDKNIADTKETIEGVESINAQRELSSDPTLETKKRSSLLGVAVTPRFVPTCSLALLKGLGELASSIAKRNTIDVLVQTHVAESLDEVEVCRVLHPPGSMTAELGGKTDTTARSSSSSSSIHGGSRDGDLADNGRDLSILDRCGLIHSRCVLAHGVHLSPKEVRLLAERGAAIAHCPLSNCYFADGVLPVKRLLDAGISVGLGTDFAGGHDHSMLSAIRSAVLVSRLLSTGVDKYDYRSSVDTDTEPSSVSQDTDDSVRRKNDRVSWQEALYLATAGGAKALGLQDRIGRIEKGLEFDALLVRVGGGDCDERDPYDTNKWWEKAASSTATAAAAGMLRTSRIDVFPTDSRSDLLQKFLYCGDDRDIAEVWVQGVKVIDNGAVVKVQ